MIKQLRYITYYLLTALLMLGCNEELTPEDSFQISFETSVQDHTSISRATIFENQNDILDDAADGKGGGNLPMYAYISNEEAVRFKSRAWFFNNVWRFYDGESDKFYNHYWPNESMDFFAYMPWDGSGKQNMITVGEHTPSTDQNSGLNITCNIPQPEDLEDTDGQETIIAYAANRSKENRVVLLHFVHPFAAVSFELKQAHRNLTINWIRFNNVHLTGTTTLKDATDNSTQISWTGTDETDDPKTFTIPVDKTIPDEINFGAKIGGPYLVMPQSLTSATITINYTWDDATDTDTSNDTYEITRSLSENWLAGNKYTYVLNLGDNQEEILFKVLVEPWDVTGDDNNIFDVE